PSVSYTSAPAAANEGDNKTYTFAVSDPGADTFAASSGKPDCGSGGSLVSGSYSLSADSGSASGSFACHFPDGSADTDVTISFTDSGGDTGNTATKPVHVTTRAPKAGFSVSP